MPEKREPDAITAISVKGFKSFADETRLEIRPLTLLAGANSSGKSSAMQPLLLLKQTLEASYDPGPLLLSDSHVKFTSASQLLHRGIGGSVEREFRVALEIGRTYGVRDIFRRKSNESFDLVQMDLLGFSEMLGIFAHASQHTPRDLSLRVGMSRNEVKSLLGVSLELRRVRCFLELVNDRSWSSQTTTLTDEFARSLRRIIHVPGLRGVPTRSYPMTAVGRSFIGTFDNYTAGVITSWQESKDSRAAQLGRSMEELGLSWNIRAKGLDATRVELLVARLPKRKRGGVADLINIADVGIGISQVLPVLVALLAAERGQLVYLEQPELHLHPRAQEALASILIEAANRGVQVVAETHSSILLLAIQALVAEGKLDPMNVKLHWFRRGADGATVVESADLDPQGAYGDWPEDFGEVRAQAENRYLDAVEAKVFPPKRPKRNAKSR